VSSAPLVRSRHPIPLRDPRLRFDASIPRVWLAGNALATHFFNGLNLVFPDGERFFIRAVRDCLADVSDPALLEQVKGFVSQEGRHAHEHQRYFDVLRAQGYRIDGFLRRFARFSAWMTRRLPAPLRLAMTAGAEHYTALFGRLALEHDLIREAHPVLERLIVWHATEEIEHKAVAFDVLREAHPGYALRVLGFVLATFVLFGWTMAGTRMLLRQDGLSRRELRAQRDALRQRDGGRTPPRLWRGMRSYLRRDFHPGEVDDLALAHRRLAELGVGALAAG
jgi:predicted metal-dependent hydrolase